MASSSMVDGPNWRYLGALLASGISVLAWLAALGSGLAAAYYSITNGPVFQFSTYMLVAIVIGAVFAQIEKRLHSSHR